MHIRVYIYIYIHIYSEFLGLFSYIKRDYNWHSGYSFWPSCFVFFFHSRCILAFFLFSFVSLAYLFLDGPLPPLALLNLVFLSSHRNLCFFVLILLKTFLRGFADFLQHSLHQVAHGYPFTYICIYVYTYIYICVYIFEFSNSPFILCFSEVFWSSYNILCTRWRIATPSHIRI